MSGERRTERLEADSRERLQVLIEERIATLAREGYLCLATLRSESPRGLWARLLHRPPAQRVELRVAKPGPPGGAGHGWHGGRSLGRGATQARRIAGSTRPLAADRRPETAAGADFRHALAGGAGG